jgi:hypothetical protein
MRYYHPLEPVAFRPMLTSTPNTPSPSLSLPSSPTCAAYCAKTSSYDFVPLLEGSDCTRPRVRGGVLQPRGELCVPALYDGELGQQVPGRRSPGTVPLPRRLPEHARRCRLDVRPLVRRKSKKPPLGSGFLCCVAFEQQRQSALLGFEQFTSDFFNSLC